MVSIFYQNFYDSELHMQITLSLRGDWWLNLVIGFGIIVFWPVAPLHHLHWTSTLVSRAAHRKFNLILILLPFAICGPWEEGTRLLGTQSLGTHFQRCILSLAPLLSGSLCLLSAMRWPILLTTSCQPRCSASPCMEPRSNRATLLQPETMSQINSSLLKLFSQAFCYQDKSC